MNDLTLDGYTEDGIPVVGFFRLFDTHGIPLEIIFSMFQKKFMIPNWLGFWEDAKKSKWNMNSTRAKLEMAIVDVFGVEYLTAWCIRMNCYLAKKDI